MGSNAAPGRIMHQVAGNFMAAVRDVKDAADKGTEREHQVRTAHFGNLRRSPTDAEKIYVNGVLQTLVPFDRWVSKA